MFKKLFNKLFGKKEPVKVQVVPDMVKLLIMTDNAYERSHEAAYRHRKALFVKNSYEEMEKDPLLSGLIRNIYIRRGFFGPLEEFRFVPGTVYDCSGMSTLCIVYVHELTDNEKLLFSEEN